MKTVAIIPAFNEEKTIRDVVKNTLAQNVCNVVVVDDGSNDSTVTSVDDLGCLVIRHKENKGYGASVVTGIAVAKELLADVIVILDADGQHDPSLINALIQHIELDPSLDFVVSSRYHFRSSAETAAPEDRYLGNKLFCRLFRVVTGYECDDFFSGFYAARVSSIVKLPLLERGYEFPVNLWFECAKRGMKRKEIPGKLIYLDWSRDFKGMYGSREDLIRCFLFKFMEYASDFLRAKHSVLDDYKVSEIIDILSQPEFHAFGTAPEYCRQYLLELQAADREDKKCAKCPTKRCT